MINDIIIRNYGEIERMNKHSKKRATFQKNQNGSIGFGRYLGDYYHRVCTINGMADGTVTV